MVLECTTLFRRWNWSTKNALCS